MRKYLKDITAKQYYKSLMDMDVFCDVSPQNAQVRYYLELLESNFYLDIFVYREYLFLRWVDICRLQSMNVVPFETVLTSVNDSLKEKLIFNLDLFI